MLTEIEVNNMLIARHSEAVQNALNGGIVGLAGLGGLGSNIAVALARIGLGTLRGFDFDVVDLSNINRQHYFLDQIGMKKAEALKQTIGRINPFVDFRFEDMVITEDNVCGLFDGCDIIIEAFDVAANKAMLFAAWQKYYPDCYYIGASGVAGWQNEPLLGIKALGKRAFIVGDMQSEAAQDKSLMAPRVGIAANMQANIAVQLLIEGVKEQ
jgi:sulfur carrier protein ThiS adenylyltransferase